MNTETAFYLFCFARSEPLPAVEGMGVDGQNPLFVHVFVDIAAVLSLASLDEFSGADCERRLQDLNWLAPRACRHEMVVEQVMRQCPVLPARFGTLFSSLESLERFLTEHHRSIIGFWNRLGDKQEWALKVLLRRDAAIRELTARTVAAQTAGAASSPGLGYLRQQHIRTKMDRELDRWLGQICREVVENLEAWASDSRQRRVIPLGSDQDGMELLLNWAFLVPRSGLADFRTRLDRLAAHHAEGGLSLQLSGPWPPYSFCPSL